MKKKLISGVLAVGMLLSSSLSAFAQFSDMPDMTVFETAINSLVEQGVMSGYEDNTFKPRNEITRAEMAKVICTTLGLEVEGKTSEFSDVPKSHWAYDYISAVNKEGIFQGVGGNKFAPEDKVTYRQLVFILTRMVYIQEGKAEEIPKIYWVATPKYAFYLNYDLAIIPDDVRTNDSFDDDFFSKMYLDNYYNDNATRQDVAVLLNNFLIKFGKQKAEFNGTEVVVDKAYIKSKDGLFYLSMDVKELPKPDKVLKSSALGEYYLYDIDTYEDFVSVHILNGAVEEIMAIGKNCEFQGYHCGDIYEHDLDAYYDEMLSMFTPRENDDQYIIWGFHFKNKQMNRGLNTLVNDGLYTTTLFSTEGLEGERELIWHMANAVRVTQGKNKVKWCDIAAQSEQEHCQDMKDRDFFGHVNPDGEKPADRLVRIGHAVPYDGENCAQCSGNAFDAIKGWMASDGHRENMLRDKWTYLGVGGVALLKSVESTRSNFGQLFHTHYGE